MADFEKHVFNFSRQELAKLVAKLKTLNFGDEEALGVVLRMLRLLKARVELKRLAESKQETFNVNGSVEGTRIRLIAKIGIDIIHGQEGVKQFLNDNGSSIVVITTDTLRYFNKLPAEQKRVISGQYFLKSIAIHKIAEVELF